MPAWASLVWLTVAGLPVAARHPRWLQQLLRVLFCFLLIVAVTFNNTRQHASPWPRLHPATAQLACDSKTSASAKECGPGLGPQKHSSL